MAVLREKPYSGMNFTVDLGSGQREGAEAGLAEIILPAAQTNAVEYRNGNERENNPRVLQTITRYGNLILRRGVIGSLSWYEWWNAMRNGDQNAERNIVISLLNEDRSNVVLSWKFYRARPLSYSFSPLNALVSQPLYETLEIAVERFDVE
jgi:phage tail-like protein